MAVMSGGLPTAGERRYAPRASFIAPVTAQLGSELVEGLGSDLSESGMRLYPQSARVPFGQPLLLSFALPAVPGRVTVRAELTRCELRDDRTVWAVVFRGVAASVRRMLRTYVLVGHGRVIEYDDAMA